MLMGRDGDAGARGRGLGGLQPLVSDARACNLIERERERQETLGRSQLQIARTPKGQTRLTRSEKELHE